MPRALPVLVALLLSAGPRGHRRLGAVLMLYTGAAGSMAMALPLGGIVGAVAGLALVTLLAGTHGSVLTLILAGIAVNTLAGALTSLALNLAPSPYAALEIVFWLLGSLADRSFEHVRLALLNHGRLVASGSVDAVLTPTNLRDCFGVRVHRGTSPEGRFVIPVERLPRG